MLLLTQRKLHCLIECSTLLKQQLVDLIQPEMMFYSSAHLNQDWSSGDCNILKRLKDVVRKIPNEEDDQVQEMLNCYDPWAQGIFLKMKQNNVRFAGGPTYQITV